jgi:hypothetical protein
MFSFRKGKQAILPNLQATIVRKKSDLLYKVNCGPRGKTQVIHSDCLRLKKLHQLSGEGDCGVNDNDVALLSDVSESDQDEFEQDSSIRSKRVRQPPV